VGRVVPSPGTQRTELLRPSLSQSFQTLISKRRKDVAGAPNRA
jgi:hypothetical protein